MRAVLSRTRQVLRLNDTFIGREAGVVSDERWVVFQSVRGELEKARELMEGVALSPHVRHECFLILHILAYFIYLIAGLGESGCDGSTGWRSTEVSHFPEARAHSFAEFIRGPTQCI